jgi:hypothetical protein
MAAGDSIAGERDRLPTRTARARGGVRLARLRFALARLVCLALALTIGTLVAAPARADDTIKRPDDHPSYAVEIEPHGVLGYGVVYPDSGFGAGARFSIPIVHNGFIPTINNSVAISFGVDAVYFDTCGGGCSATYLDFPVALQWNFYVARHWSVFGEPGLVVGHGFLSGTYGFPDTWVYPAFFAGARYQLSEKVSLTMRVGFPTLFSFGVSFFL